MKLKDCFIIYQNDDEKILMDSSSNFSGFARLNQTAFNIVEFLKDETTEKEIVEKMLMKYQGDEEKITADVQKIIKQLSEIGAIE